MAEGSLKEPLVSPLFDLVCYSVVFCVLVFLWYNARMQPMKEWRNRARRRRMDAEIELSKAHWSELRESDKRSCAEANVAFFRSLQQLPHGEDFFKHFSEVGWELGEKIAEGAQGEIFQIKNSDQHVMKVFKLEGGSLEDLHKQWPSGMLETIQNDKEHIFHVKGASPVLLGLLFEDGRFGFVMKKYRGDLRKFIEERIKCRNQPSLFDRLRHRDNQVLPSSPVLNPSFAFHIMYKVALGMKELHAKGIVHGDLKASNVLLKPSQQQGPADCPNTIDPVTGKSYLNICIADYECSVGVVGTGFWRAPEILLAVKNRCCQANMMTMESDIYSFGMTCYEILTCKIPLEGERANDYDVVLPRGGERGKRPELPSDTYPWIRIMLERCWEHEPFNRPSSQEIVQKFEVVLGRLKKQIPEKLYKRESLARCEEVEKQVFSDLLQSNF